MKTVCNIFKYNILVYIYLDIDECSIMHGVCGDGECQNIPGSFVCKCKEGYETSQLMQVCMGNNPTIIIYKRYIFIHGHCLFL